MTHQNNPGQRDTNVNIQKNEFENSKKEIVSENKSEVLTPELAATKLSEIVLRYQLGQVPMPEVRRSINLEARVLSLDFNEAQKKEFSLALRTKFERMKQFAEASHQEIISLTSQIGW